MDGPRVAQVVTRETPEESRENPQEQADSSEGYSASGIAVRRCGTSDKTCGHAPVALKIKGPQAASRRRGLRIA